MDVPRVDELTETKKGRMLNICVLKKRRVGEKERRKRRGKEELEVTENEEEGFVSYSGKRANS